MTKIKQTACGLLLALSLVGCSQQPAGVVGVQQPVTEIASVLQEPAKEVKEGEEGKFHVQGWKDKTAKVAYNIVKYYVVDKAFEGVSKAISNVWSNTDYGRASKAQADYAKSLQQFYESCKTAKFRVSKCPR